MTSIDGARRSTGDDSVVLVVEPLLPQRIRRPSDLLRFLATLLALAAVVLLALVAQKTLNGLKADVQTARTGRPFLLSGLAGVLSGAAVLASPWPSRSSGSSTATACGSPRACSRPSLGMVLSFALGEWIIYAARRTCGSC